MREIRFRAWDKTNKEMVKVRQIVIPDGKNENGLQELSISGLKYGANPSHWLIAPPLMQYIGLHDKKGVEIYEGDYLLTDEAGWRAKVIFERGSFFLVDGKGGFSVEPNWEECEVIGNCYEHPDLLEK